MRRIFLLLTSIFSLTHSVSWHVNPTPTATLVERCESRCTSYFRMVETTLTLRILNPPAETAVLRVCSKQPMPLALASANMRPHIYADFIERNQGIPRDRILFLRSEDCLSLNPGIVATELWSVPKGAELPSHLEEIKSCQYQFRFLGTKPKGAGEFEGAIDYRNALSQLIAGLRADPNTIGVVWGYYLMHPSRAMNRRMAEVKKVMVQSGLPENRYQVKVESQYDPEEKPNPKYPSVFLVKVLDGCVK